MITLTGKGISGAIVYGPIFVLRRRTEAVTKYYVDDVKAEQQRLDAAKEMAKAQLRELYHKALRELGEADAAIFDIHRMMIEDEEYNEAIRNLMKQQSVNAEYAVEVTAEKFSAIFAAKEEAYVRERAADVRDISNRIISCLLKEREETSSDAKVIVCADELTPSEVLRLDRDRIIAFVTAYGSLNSHAAILARDRNIPAIIGVGEALFKEVRDGAMAIVDSDTGEFFIHPEEKVKARLERSDAREGAQSPYVEQKEKRADVYANMDDIEDMDLVLANAPDGIGLFRSEFLYLKGSDYPTEEQQFAVYKKVLESMEGRKVIIRTMDMGADKQADYMGLDKETNPALGYRGIRISLTRPKLLKTQLRALYRASAYGNLGIMFPMIISVSEVEEVLSICREVRLELKEEGKRIEERVELGIMIETPAAALLSDRLAPLVDFFCIGCNDLIQYTLACDRQNPAVEQFVDMHHEAVLCLIEMSAQNAHRHGIWIGICGELAADTTLTEVLLRMGIQAFSVSPALVKKVKAAVRGFLPSDFSERRNKKKETEDVYE